VTRRGPYLLLFLALLAGVAVPVVVMLVGKLNRPAGPEGGSVPWPGDDPIWRTRHAEFVADSQNGGYDVLCLGDSLTWGWDDHRDVWAERVTPRRTAFHAIGNETTNGLLWRIDHGELDGLDPKLVVVLIGTNNRWVTDDPDDIAGGIAAVVGRLRERLSRAKVLVLGLLPQGRSANDASRRVFAEVNRRVAAFDGGPVAVRDVGGCLLEPDGSLSDAISPDGTHLTRAGYARLADALGPLVRERVGD
jgi:lysophospholipase L1-like esterase